MTAQISFVPNRLLTVLVILFLCLACVTAAKAGEPGNMQGMTAAHNSIRSKLGIAPLEWSDKLANYAQGQATQLAKNNSCSMRHAPSGRYGENLFWASAVKWSNGKRKVQAVNAQHVVESWEQEERDYDQQTKRCRTGAVCGHYTQIIWGNSKELGCGMAVCADKEQIWVCNYSPPGNVLGQAPY